MITERLMKPGQWSLRFREDAPFSLLNKPDWFDLIIITPTRLLPLESYSDANVLASAIYAGVVVDRPSLYDIGGEGLAYLLGTDDGTGEIAIGSPISNTAGTLNDWFDDLLPVNGLTKGTVTNTGVTLTWDDQYMTRREAIDYVCKTVGAEWVVNPDLTVDAAAPSTLFVSTPTVVITRKPEGTEGATIGIEATQASRNSTIRGYANTIGVIGQNGDGAKVASAVSIGSNVYKHPGGGNISMERLANAPTAPAGTVQAYADALLAANSAPRTGIELSSATYAVPRHARPGDSVYVYDLQAGLTDDANQTMWRGELISPVMLRVKSYTWGVPKGMGVYLRHYGSAVEYTDLSDAVMYEQADTSWEVGWITTAQDPDLDPSQQAPAYLGVNGQILDRVGTGKKITFTPTWSGTLGDGTLTGNYVRIGDLCEGWIDLVWGSTTSHAAATQLFTLPFTADRSFGSIGEARLEDVTVARYERVCTLTSTTQFYMETEAGVIVTNTVPWTMGNGDKTTVHFRFFCA